MLRAKILEIWQNQEIFEEMDRLKIELEMAEAKTAGFWEDLRLMTGAGLFLGTSTWIFGARRGFLIGVGGLFLTYKWYLRKLKSLKIAIQKMEKLQKLCRKKQQTEFCIFLRIPQKSPILIKSCQLSIDFIRKLWRSDTDETALHNFYPPEISRVFTAETAADSLEHLEMLQNLARLHLSEFCAEFLCSRESLNHWRILELARFADNFAELEKMATPRVKIAKTRRNPPADFNTWKYEVALGLEAISAKLQDDDDVAKVDIEKAVRKLLEILGKTEIVENLAENVEKLEIPEEIDEQMRPIEKNLNLNLDLMFEGQSMSDAEKSRKCGAARDHFLDGCEARRHEKSLLGELAAVLEPRRATFAHREKLALARFYGCSEGELEEKLRQEEQKKEQEILDHENLEPENYDWKLEAENREGIHRAAENLDFLQILKQKCVRDEIIE
ncbi:unnamed protein product [Caenorhabditis angaria]|uniref:Uncharacterized protein n=1 Tax=Caenorhabditis angaria TaxID=860376 RepID=A0A9P1N3V8_9PELO|nr:unnamed protein product [Caenorhabditis angaria]